MFIPEILMFIRGLSHRTIQLMLLVLVVAILTTIALVLSSSDVLFPPSCEDLARVETMREWQQAGCSEP